MADIEMNEEFVDEPIVLVDEETGEEKSFKVLDRAEIDGGLYFALTDVNEESDEYYILKATIDGEDILFETVDDDDEFDKVEDYFNDSLFGEVDYDEE